MTSFFYLSFFVMPVFSTSPSPIFYSDNSIVYPASAAPFFRSFLSNGRATRRPSQVYVRRLLSLRHSFLRRMPFRTAVPAKTLPIGHCFPQYGPMFCKAFLCFKLPFLYLAVARFFSHLWLVGLTHWSASYFST